MELVYWIVFLGIATLMLCLFVTFFLMSKYVYKEGKEEGYTQHGAEESTTCGPLCARVWAFLRPPRKRKGQKRQQQLTEFRWVSRIVVESG